MQRIMGRYVAITLRPLTLPNISFHLTILQRDSTTKLTLQYITLSYIALLTFLPRGTQKQHAGHASSSGNGSVFARR